MSNAYIWSAWALAQTSVSAEHHMIIYFFIDFTIRFIISLFVINIKSMALWRDYVRLAFLMHIAV